MNSAVNPLLDFSDLPRFDAIHPAHVAPAVDRLLATARAAVESVATDACSATWDVVVEPLAEPLDELDRAWGTTPASQRGRARPMAQRVSHEYRQGHRLLHRPRAGFQALCTLSRARRRAFVRRARRREAAGRHERIARFPAGRRGIAGRAEGPPQGRGRGARGARGALRRQPARRHQRVGALHHRAQRIGGNSGTRGRRGARCGGSRRQARLEAHTAHAVLSAGRELRRQPRAPRNAASGLHDARFRSGGLPRVGQQPRHPAPPPAATRSRAASRLSELRLPLSLVPKMANSVDEVLVFLRDLARRAKPYAVRDYADLQAFAAAELGLVDLAPWDRAYASRSSKARKFTFSEQQVRRYFPEAKVLRIVRVATLYSISIRAGKAATWHADVRFFDVLDASGALIGQFYLDNYARPGKQGGAWQDDAINRRRAGAHVQHPVTYLHLQPFGAGRNRAGNLHPRRSDHPLPRVRPRPAPASDSRRGGGSLRHPGRRMGC